MSEQTLWVPPRYHEQRRQAVLGDASRRPLSLNGLGGPRNYTTGLGGTGDHFQGTLWEPSVFSTKDPLEVIYVESWAVRRFVDIPVDDLFLRFRRWDTDDEGLLKAILEAERHFKLTSRLSSAMKAARLYGTGLLVLVTDNSPLEEELNVDMIKEDGLVNIVPVDRYDASIIEWEEDLWNVNYGGPLYYGMTFGKQSGPNSQYQDVHESRVLRFDGQRPLSITGWSSSYDEDWGMSELIPVLTTILQEHITAAAATHLLQESSIPVFKLQNFARVNRGEADIDDPKLDIVASNFSDQKSNFRMMLIDANEDFMRVEVNMAGIPQLMDENFKRLAAAGGIPETRYLGTPPVGFNATGDLDRMNYAMLIKAMQQNGLTDPMTTWDQVLARHLGVSEMPQYEWVSLIDFSELEILTNTKMLVETLAILVDKGMILEEEARNILISRDDIFTDLPERTVPTEEEIEARRQESLMMLQAQMGQGEEDADSLDESTDSEEGGVGGAEDEPDPDAPQEEGQNEEGAEGESEDDEEEGNRRRRRVAGLTDEESRMAALGDADRKLDDIEPTEALENQIENEIRKDVTSPMLRRMTARAKNRWPAMTTADTQNMLNELRLRANVRVKNYVRFQTRRGTAKLTQVRLKAVGVKRYIWETMRDDRVRPTHRTKEGKIYSFDNPPADTGNPGNDFNCRCKARPLVAKNVERILKAKHIVDKPVANELETLLDIAKMERQRSSAVLTAFRNVVSLNSWHRRQMEEIFEKAMKVRLGGRIQNNRIRRSEAALARLGASEIEKLAADIREDLEDVVISALVTAGTIAAIGALTADEEKELDDIQEEARIIWRRGPGLSREERDRLFELGLRSKMLLHKGKRPDEDGLGELWPVARE